MKSLTGLFLSVSLFVRVAWAGPLVLLQSRESPLVDSNQLSSGITAANLTAHAVKLQEFSDSSPDHNRFAGLIGNNMTVDYIYDTLVATNSYNVVKQGFRTVYYEGNATLSVNGKSYQSGDFTYSASTHGKTITGQLVQVFNSGCSAKDFSPGVAGKIVLIPTGDCEYGLKVAYAGAAKAIGAIIFNDKPGAMIPSTLGEKSRLEGPYVPTGAVTGEDGAELSNLISKGNATASMVVNSYAEDRFTSNVFATTKTGDRNHQVLAGAHTDSVATGPGINGGGSGAISILEIALQLTKFSVKNAVRFCFFSGEEHGLLGSNFYLSTITKDDFAKIVLYLNFNVMASPNFGYFIHDGSTSAVDQQPPNGSKQIEKLFVSYFESVKIPTVSVGMSQIDSDTFLSMNVPCGGIFTGGSEIKTPHQATLWGGQSGVAFDANYHKPGDTINNLNTDAWVQTTKGAAHAIGAYASSLDNLLTKREEYSHVKRDLGSVDASGRRRFS